MDWNDLKPFLALARDGTLTAAARRLHVDHATVSRRVDALEDALGARLFDRSPRGYRLTEAGQRLLPHAEAVETQILSLTNTLSGRDHAPEGIVRLATPEAFGSQFLSYHLSELRARHPGIEIELVAETRPHSLSKREADIAVTFARPEHGRLVAVKLTQYRLRLYGSRAYLDRHPPIASLADLKAHDFIWYVDDLLQFEELRGLMAKTFRDPKVVFRSTSVAAQLNAARAGVGLALLHCFHADREPDLHCVLPDAATATRDLWLVAHEDLAPLPRIRAVSKFLSEIVAREQPLLLGKGGNAH